MKKIFKLFSVFIALIASIVMIDNVAAESAGSITINGTKNNETYNLYKIFDLTYSGNKVSYTMDEDWINFFNSEDGSSFITSTKADGLNPITVYLDDNGKYTTEANATESKTRYINIVADGETAAANDVIAFSKAALKYTTSVDKDGFVTSTSETTTVDGLALGYYLIYNGGNKTAGNYKTLVSLDSTTPSATVNVKSEFPGIKKEITKVNKNSMDADTKEANTKVGDKITFELTGIVPDTTGYTTFKYEISDTMTAGLTFNNGVVVTFGDATITPKTGELTLSDTGFVLSFDMTKYQTYKGKTITVTYTGTVNKNAVNTQTRNDVKLEYSTNPKNATETFTDYDTNVVYTASIKVLKYEDGTDKTAIPNTKFVLKNSDGKYYKATGATESDTSAATKVEWVDSIDNATVLTTDENGNVVFAGVEAGTYQLIETEAADGYNKLPNPIDVTVTNTTEAITAFSFGEVEDEDLTTATVGVEAKSEISNTTGIALPSTGGIGTAVFVIVGSLLMISSALVLLTNKRMKNELN